VVRVGPDLRTAEDAPLRHLLLSEGHHPPVRLPFPAERAIGLSAHIAPLSPPNKTHGRPYDARIWCAMAACYEEVGRVGDAIKCYERAESYSEGEVRRLSWFDSESTFSLTHAHALPHTHHGTRTRTRTTAHALPHTHTHHGTRTRTTAHTPRHTHTRTCTTAHASADCNERVERVGQPVPLIGTSRPSSALLCQEHPATRQRTGTAPTAHSRRVCRVSCVVSCHANVVRYVNEARGSGHDRSAALPGTLLEGAGPNG